MLLFLTTSLLLNEALLNAMSNYCPVVFIKSTNAFISIFDHKDFCTSDLSEESLIVNWVFVTPYLNVSLWLHQSAHYSQGGEELWLLGFRCAVSEKCGYYGVVGPLPPGNAVNTVLMKREAGPAILSELGKHFPKLLTWPEINTWSSIQVDFMDKRLRTNYNNHSAKENKKCVLFSIQSSDHYILPDCVKIMRIAVPYTEEHLWDQERRSFTQIHCKFKCNR